MSLRWQRNVRCHFEVYPGAASGVKGRPTRFVGPNGPNGFLFAEHTRDDAGRAIYRVVDRAELDQHGASPRAAFFLEGIPPYMSSGAFTGEFIRNAALRGNHGFLPTEPDMHTEFVAFGAGIRQARLEVIELIDIAPTLATLMGFDMPDVEGRGLEEIFK